MSVMADRSGIFLLWALAIDQTDRCLFGFDVPSPNIWYRAQILIEGQGWIPMLVTLGLVFHRTKHPRRKNSN